VAFALGGVLAAGSLVACSSGPVPYHDDHSVGQIALVNSDGKVVTSGSINDKPFVAMAVSLQKAPAPYDAPGRKATLLAYQPRKGVDPSLWGNDFLTGSTDYPDPAEPTARTIDSDISLANFIHVFPPDWDGFIQLRIYLGAPGVPTRSSSYVTADIKVSGDTWTMVAGATSLPGGVPSFGPTPTRSG
jgi:hypothetical protein